MLSATSYVDRKDFESDAKRQDMLEERVSQRVANSSYAALRHVTVNHQGGVVTLRGEVPTYFLKQVAQSIAHDVEGVRCVVNNLEVHGRNVR